MQQRRFRPGDVLDDYCPRERRVTDHAIVAMIDDNIKQTRCVACDVEHEYKQAKVPPQRKKKAPALYAQVLDGLQAPTRKPHLPGAPDDEPALIHDEETDVEATTAGVASAVVVTAPPVGSINSGNGSGNSPDTDGARAAGAPEQKNEVDAPPPQVVDGPFRRQLIRAALPRPEGTPPPVRAIPEFTIRQPTGRANRHGHGAGRRRGQPQAQGQGQNGPARFGRSANGQRSNGHGRPGGHGNPGGQGNHGNHAGSGGAHGNRSGGSRRGGKKR